jgi:PAS domain S-box-containing protein
LSVPQQLQLPKSDEWLHLALETGRMGTWEWIIESNEVICSPGLETLLGLPPGTFPGTFAAFEQGIHPDDRDNVLRALQETVASGREIHAEYRVPLPDGSLRWVESRGKLFRGDGQRPTRLIGVSIDVGRHKELQRQLQERLDELLHAEERIRSVVDHVVDGIVTIDDRGTILSFNRAAESIFGYQAGEVLGQNVRLLMPDPYRREHDQYLAHYHQTGQARIIGIGREVLGCRKDGSVFPIELGVSQFGVDQQRYFTGIVRDITERKRIATENARLYAELKEADRRKDDFLAMLAHELRNPLTPLSTGVDLLDIAGVETETVDVMRRQVDLLVRLVDDLLDVSRVARGKVQLKRERVELGAVARQAIEAARVLIDAHGHALTVALPERPVYVEADPMRLTQVITNLLNNAAKYTEPGGQIRLDARVEADWAVLEVRDNGIGISKDLLPRIFDLFTQADRSLERAQGGLGIGLTLVRNLVEMHGGTVSAQSDGEGRGSTFVVRLPTATAPAETEPPSAPAAASGPRRILIVDDLAASATLLSRLLKNLDAHEIRTAGDGPAALEIAAAFAPEIVLLDIGLPQMSGYEVAQRLRQLPSLGPMLLVALTGYGSEDDRRRAREAGFDVHLVKPPSIAALRKLLAHPKLAAADRT